MANNGLLSFIAGFGTGYLNQEDKRAQRERQDKLDQILLDRADRETADYNKKRADEAAVKAAVAPVAVTAGAGGSVRPDTMDDRDVGLPENQGQPNAGLIPGGFRVSQQTFQDQASADQAAAAQNAPDARNARLMSVMQGIDPMRAAELDSRIKQNKLADTQVAEAERKRMLTDAIGAFSQGGWAAVPKLYDRYNDGLTAKVQEDGKGGATITRLDKDGNVVDSTPFPNKMSFLGTMMSQFDPKHWMDSENHKIERQQDQGNKDRDFGLREQEMKQRAQQSSAQLGIQQAQLGIQQAAAARAAEHDASEAPTRQLKTILSTLQLGLANTDDPAQRQVLQDKISAIKAGIGLDPHATAEEKNANAFLRAGLAKTPAEALRMATSTKDASESKLKSELLKAGLTASNGDIRQAIKNTEAGMKYLAPSAAAAAISPPSQAIEMLKKDPGLAAKFDEKYGAGAASRVLK